MPELTRDLTDAQWAVLAPLLPKPRVRADGRGRPWRAPRDVLHGIRWILTTGAAWHDLPARYPPYQTCHRRFQTWVRAGVLDRVLPALAEDCRDRGHLDRSEGVIDAPVVVATTGGREGPPHAGHGQQDPGTGRPRWAACRPRRGQCFTGGGHARRAAPRPLRHRRAPGTPDRRPGVRLRPARSGARRSAQERAVWGMELSAPHRRKRRKATTPAGQPLRRYRRRWTIARLNAWLQNYRRVLGRWERQRETCRGFVQLACMRILLRHS